jgi:CubicO group peptidase (beta-lactamase class C family)
MEGDATMERFNVVRAAFIVFSALSIAVLGSACASDVTMVSGAPAGSLDHAQRKQIDAFVESALERYDVPGVAIAVIKDGQVAYQAGFGVRDKDDGRPMTTSTLFALASLSKPMTTTMMASLADDGLLDWDQPVHEIISSSRSLIPSGRSRSGCDIWSAFQAGCPRTTRCCSSSVSRRRR